MAVDLIGVCAAANDAAQGSQLATFLAVLFSVFVATALFVATLAIYAASGGVPDDGKRARPTASPPPQNAATLFASAGDVPLVSLRAGLG